ncbi:hypothetical protein [Altibacter sp.]|uniref:hypothetical protein n=1 Tax=Altibacter sp. TaxID=2024823 RepID=UPI0025C14051|nr:hypothetical protein [Altibacter sp.]
MLRWFTTRSELGAPSRTSDSGTRLTLHLLAFNGILSEAGLKFQETLSLKISRVTSSDALKGYCIEKGFWSVDSSLRSE